MATSVTNLFMRLDLIFKFAATRLLVLSIPLSRRFLLAAAILSQNRLKITYKVFNAIDFLARCKHVVSIRVSSIAPAIFEWLYKISQGACVTYLTPVDSDNTLGAKMTRVKFRSATRPLVYR